jgi:hypothetical protein
MTDAKAGAYRADASVGFHDISTAAAATDRTRQTSMPATRRRA